MSPCGGFVDELDRFVAKRAEECGGREGDPMGQKKEVRASLPSSRAWFRPLAPRTQAGEKSLSGTSVCLAVPAWPTSHVVSGQIAVPPVWFLVHTVGLQVVKVMIASPEPSFLQIRDPDNNSNKKSKSSTYIRA